jgi:glucose-6-phosphate 1-dehydrogenase
MSAHTGATSRRCFAILGASGDLTRRLLMPALARLDAAGQLGDVHLQGFALEPWSSAEFRARMRAAVQEFAPEVPPQAVERLAGRLGYVSGKLDPRSLERLAPELPARTVFYLALPPATFGAAATALAEAGLAGPERTMVIEKPFGRDLASARALNAELHRHWRECQIFRIDHFLGKESVQNLLVFRFANRFLEPVLSAQHIEQVQITAGETLGVEGRYRYYDGIGATRDMLQNHLMQLFALSAIDPPARWDAEVLHDHKVEVLKSVIECQREDVGRCAARGQYTSGAIGGRSVSGYRQEPHIAANSRTETFAALRLASGSWRWAGVPFYLRSGKRLAADLTEVAYLFKQPPAQLFRATPLEGVAANQLVFRIKPDETVELIAEAKRPGLTFEPRQLILRARYTRTGDRPHGAYEQLLLDVLTGDRLPFLRFDEVEWSWRILDPILRAFEDGEPEPYPAGSEGPAGQHAILENGHRWRPIAPPERLLRSSDAEARAVAG